MKYVSVDIETSSLDPERGQILEIAMVVEDVGIEWNAKLGNHRAHVLPLVEKLPFYHAIIGTKRSQITGEPFALAMNARLLTALAHGEGKLREEVEGEADAWLAEHIGPGLVTMAAKNGAGFDLVWLKRHMPALASRFSHRVIDPGSVLIDWHEGPVSLGKLLGGEAKHEALEDARDNIRALRKAYS